MKNIHAHTDTRHSSPGYISINDEDGRITVSVRTRGGQVPSIVELNRDELQALCNDIGTFLALTAPVAVEVPTEPVTVTAVDIPKPAKGEA